MGREVLSKGIKKYERDVRRCGVMGTVVPWKVHASFKEGSHYQAFRDSFHIGIGSLRLPFLLF